MNIMNGGKKKPEESISGAAVREVLKNLVRWLRPKSESLKESFEELIELREESGEKIDPEEKQMLSNVLAFADLRVDQVMTPRAYIDAVNEGITLEEFEKFIAEKRHTRFPVYRKTLDEAKGFIHVKDLFPYLGGDRAFAIKEILRPILFIPPSMHIIDLLARMRVRRVHIALVIDEYGGVKGLVTMEDLMEKIVGEIEDEHDESESEHDFSQIDSFAFEAAATMPIGVLEEKLGMKIFSDEEKENFDTLGGMIFTRLGRVPVKGEIIDHSAGLGFEVLDADNRRVKKILIRKNIPQGNFSAG